MKSLILLTLFLLLGGAWVLLVIPLTTSHDYTTLAALSALWLAVGALGDRIEKQK